MNTTIFKTGIGLAWLLFLTHTCFAQLALHNTTGLYVESGALLHVDGDLDNLSTIEGRGDIEVTGNVDNQGQYRAFGQGRVILKGSSSSTISGNWEGNDAFYRLHLAKSVGIPVRLTNNIHIDDTLNLQGGLFQTLSNHVFITSADTGLLTGYPLPGASVDDRYILGNLRRAVGQTQAQYDFPIGDGLSLAGYQLARIEGNNFNGTSEITMRYEPATTYPAPMAPECGATFDCMLTGVGEWVMVPNGGIPQFDLTLVPRNYSGGCGGGSYTVLTDGSLAGIACTGFNGTLNAFLGTEITREGLQSIGPFTITGSAASFPVEWLSFDAWPDGEVARLEWVTAMEENNAYFDVERSSNGIDFTPIGQVESLGNSDEPVSYTFEDQHPVQGKNYYRLRQVDLDGQFSYSDLRVVQFRGFGISLWPNPFTDRITIDHDPVPGSPLRLMLYNGLGQPVIDKLLLPLGRQEMELSHLPEGAYTYLFISEGRRIQTGKLVRMDW